MSHPFYLRGMQGEPTLLYAAKEDSLSPGAEFGPVIRDHYIVECCTSGEGAVRINDVEYPVKSGDCYVLFPGDSVVHKASLTNPRAGLWCAFKGLGVGQILARGGIDSRRPFAPSESFGEASGILADLLREKPATDQGAELRRTADLYRLLSALIRYRVRESGEGVIKKAIGMMEARCHERIGVDEVADFVGLERSYFSTLFKRETGLSPHRYLNRLRIDRAGILIRGGIPIALAAENVGLDPQNFSRLFKRETGLCPLQYKKKQKEEEKG